MKNNGESLGKLKVPHNKKPHLSEYQPRDVDEIPVMEFPSTDPFFSQAQIKNKLMVDSFHFPSHNGSALLDTGTNQSLVNIHFACLAKLPLGPSCCGKSRKLMENSSCAPRNTVFHCHRGHANKHLEGTCDRR